MGETRKHQGVLSSWNRDGNASKETWKIVQACIGGQFGKRGTTRALRKQDI